MSFGDLKSASGLAALNEFLSTRSYIEGYKPSQADVSVAVQISLAFDGAKYAHVNRWLQHILAFPSCVRDHWPGKKGASSASAAAPAEEKSESAAAKGDDDFMSLDDDDDGDDLAAILAAKKKAKPEEDAPGKKKKEAAKSSIVWDVKPEDSDTNLDSVTVEIKKIAMEGLHWGDAKQIPVAYGIFKIRIMCTVVDELVSQDDLQETLEKLAGVQSVDIFSWNKI